MQETPDTARLGTAHDVSSRFAVAAAACTSVIAAVGLDLAGGASASHSLTLGALAMLLSLARIRHVGRYRAVFGFLSAALVAPSAMHPFIEASGAAAPRLETGSGWVQAFLTTAAHVTIAAGVVVAVGSAEFQIARVERIVGRAVRLLVTVLRLRPSPPGFALCAVAYGPVRQVREWVGYAARRGPPRVGALVYVRRPV